MAVESPPIIIKKIRKGGHGHHGGAWKVAFADFVTAMMAFFMLLWLMAETTPQQKQAISNYMQDPITASGPGGAGANPVIDGGAGLLDNAGKSVTPQENKPETEEPKEPTTPEEEARKIAEAVERQQLETLREQMEQALSAQALQPYKDQLLLDITSEGLRIQIVDKENRPMFAQGSPVLQSYTREILHEIVKVIKTVPNKISISGHTDRTPYAATNGYSNWELSADRANAARRELLAGGLEEDKLGRVVGLSSSVLFDKQNPFNPTNRRISIIVMNKAAEEAVTHGEGAQEDQAIPRSDDLPPPAPKADLEDIPPSN